MKKQLVLLLTVLLSACSSIKTDLDYETTVDFSKYQTWAWLDTPTQTSEQYHLNGLMDQRIRSAVQAQLTAQGLSEVALEQADLKVNYLTKVDQRIRVDNFHTQLGYYPFTHSRMHHPIHQPPTEVRQYEEGTLIIDLIDASSNRLIWRSSATEIIQNNLTPEQKQARVNQAVEAILQQFPPSS